MKSYDMSKGKTSLLDWILNTTALLHCTCEIKENTLRDTRQGGIIQQLQQKMTFPIEYCKNAQSILTRQFIGMQCWTMKYDVNILNWTNFLLFSLERVNAKCQLPTQDIGYCFPHFNAKEVENTLKNVLKI